MVGRINQAEVAWRLGRVRLCFSDGVGGLLVILPPAKSGSEGGVVYSRAVCLRLPGQAILKPTIKPIYISLGYISSALLNYAHVSISPS